MKAVLFHTHGGADVLEYADFPTPEPGPGEALVRLKAAALNGLDLWVRAGWPGIKLEYPHIPGADGAGEVVALGSGVTKIGTQKDFKAVMELVFAGRLKPVLDRSFPLVEARAAQERLEKGEQMGKITLEIG